MQKQVDNIQSDIKEIKSALLGDDFRDGIISEENKNTEHRRNSMKTSGFIAGTSIIFGGVLGKFWDKIIHIF